LSGRIPNYRKKPEGEV